MTRHHIQTRTEDWNRDILAATNALFDAKPWRADIGAINIYANWARNVSDVYGIVTPIITCDESDQIGYRYIDSAVPEIVLGRLSIASLFCAYAHHLAANGFYLVGQEDDIHVGIMNWGYSLFYVCRPVMFRRRVREGRILGMTARDTFSSSTWAELTSLGLTNGNMLVDPAFDIRTLESQDDLVNPTEEAEANDTSDLAPVIDLPVRTVSVDSNPSTDRLLVLQQLDQFNITELRKASRGRVIGGYRIGKAELITKLVDAGVTFDDVREANL